MTRGEMRTKVISRLQEEPNPRQWTRTEIDEYLNEGVDEFNKLAWQLRLEIIYTIGLYANIFPVPANALEIIAGHFWDGTEDRPLLKTTRGQLDDEEGRGWQDDTSSIPDAFFEALVQKPPYVGIRDYLSLYQIPTTTAITIAQEDLSAELSGIGELVWLDGNTARGIPLGLSDQSVYAIDGNQFGQIVGVYERETTDDTFKIECVKRPRLMANDGDEPEIREANHMAVVNFALYKCFERPGETRDPKIAANYWALFDDDRKANKGQPIVRQQRSVKPWEV